ncbi:NAD(P)/FAD-dependent oxidoreductase [Paenibacillus pinistramenti]|uniref:NAD(P)/FAD-dependent oxidoreductase n=1 Tax=Paenibacillus pinistramenti TaxID=1768003 RepID=UPI001EF0B3C9|nr:FAD-dependent oxidoreductase [Paenibacillus pinistramenti]
MAGQVHQYPSLSRNVQCEVLIIGGGLSGALAACTLAKSGRQVILLEKQRIASGSSSANTGLIQYTSDKTLTSCIHTFGEEQGVRFYKSCLDAVKGLLDMDRELGGAGEMFPRNSLYFASSDEDLADLYEEYETLHRYGLPAEWLNRGEIASRFPFAKPGAIYTSGDAELNPYRLIHALMTSAAAKGAEIYENSPVTGFHHEGNHVRCRSGEHVITANHVIIAAGYESQEIRRDRGAYLTQSFALVTEPVSFLDQWHEKCLIWESARPYLYLRTTPDHRIIVGGLDEQLSPSGLDEARFRSRSEVLLERLAELFPQAAGVKAEYAWGAVFGQSRDGLPFIGEHPDYPGCWFMEGYGGNGAVYSYIAARLITQAIMGERSPDLELYALKRSSRPSPARSRS